MTRQQATEIVARFNCDLGEYRSTDAEGNVDMAATIDGIVDALATTDYGDGTPTADELEQIRAALTALYVA